MILWLGWRGLGRTVKKGDKKLIMTQGGGNGKDEKDGKFDAQRSMKSAIAVQDRQIRIYQDGLTRLEKELEERRSGKAGFNSASTISSQIERQKKELAKLEKEKQRLEKTIEQSRTNQEKYKNKPIKTVDDLVVGDYVEGIQKGLFRGYVTSTKGKNITIEFSDPEDYSPRNFVRKIPKSDLTKFASKRGENIFKIGF